MLPFIVVISWPGDPERGIEAHGTWDSAEEASAWIDQCEEARIDGWPLLDGAHYLITHLDKVFDPAALWEMGNDAAH